jgi:hypothetical protein
MSDEFDWNDFDRDLIVEPARKVAVYLNPDNQLVIRQERNEYIEMEDPFIVVPLRDVPRLIEKLEKLIKAN